MNLLIGLSTLAGPSLIRRLLLCFQVILLPDGTVAHPIHRRGPDHPADGNLILGALPHPCSRNSCHEVFAGPWAFCSLRCRHIADED